MTPERYQQIDQLLELALEREPGQRLAFLKEASAGDEALRQEVEALLAAHEQAGSFIEAPALAAAEGLAEHRIQSLVGRQLGPYTISSLLGMGGMGEVYLAQDTRLDRPVALKVLPPGMTSDPDRLRRFVKEAKAASLLNHLFTSSLWTSPHFWAVSSNLASGAGGISSLPIQDEFSTPVRNLGIKLPPRSSNEGVKNLWVRGKGRPS